MDKVKLEKASAKIAPRKRGAIFITLAAALLILLAIVAFLLGFPLRYSAARAALDRGDYERAELLFTGFNYMDSAELSRKCVYLRAASLLSGGEYAEAEKLFISLGSYEDSPEQVSRCEYELAMEIFDSGDYFSALRAFEALSYGDSAYMAELCRSVIHDEAYAAMQRCQFDAARELLSHIPGYADSDDMSSYCARRMEAEAERGENIYIRPDTVSEQCACGMLYGFDSGLIYVPESCDESTGMLVLYPGGDGDFFLNVAAMRSYLEEYQPQSIIVFFYTSGSWFIEERSRNALNICEHIAMECGVCGYEVNLIGISNGAYAALHGAAQFYTLGGIRVRRVVVMDAGLDWQFEPQLDENERAIIAQTGCCIYLFEQPKVRLEHEPIRLMAKDGIDVTMVYCRRHDHDALCTNAFRFGVLSWCMGELDSLDSEEYTVSPISAQELTEYYDQFSGGKG